VSDPTNPRPRNKSQEAKAARQASARRHRGLRIGAVAAGVAVLVGVAVLAFRGGPTAVGSGDPAHWALPSLGGSGEVHLADFAGKPTVVNFFASWCDQCRAELPGFARVSKEMAGRVNFVGVNSLDDGQGLPMARQFGIDVWPLARDLGSGSTGELHDRLGGQGMPITAFYGPSGKLVDFADGGLPEATLRAKLRDLFGLNL
jgi:thiol-disulfide isomerase/thioredoxin